MVKKKLMVLAAFMCIATAVYLSTVVHAAFNSNSEIEDVIYAAFEYEGIVNNWYMPEQLGIIKIVELGNETQYWLQVVVDREKEPFPLQREQPIFKYKGEFFRISNLWVTPGLPENLQWQLPAGGAIGVGWSFTGLLFVKWRSKNEKDDAG